MGNGANGLKRRHVEFLTIGGTVGGGLFLGVGQGIQAAGPGMILAFLLAGAAVSVVARCLGEMALAAGGRATFVRTTRLNLGRRTAFVEGWSYWACAVLTCMAELAGAGTLVSAWLPNVSSWIVGLPVLVLLSGLNRLEVRRFGEVEFWMALLKVAACLVVIALGGLSLVRPMVSGARISDLWNDGGMLPHGWHGLLLALPVAVFAFGGSELVGLAAADAVEPSRRTGRFLIRITALYVGVTVALLVVMPWRNVPVSNSPFVAFLSRFGLPAAATIMALVLLSAVLSSGNSCLYAASRVLASLADEELAPLRLGRRNRKGAPASAVTASSCLVVVAVALEAVAPARLFAVLLAASAMTGLMNWAIFVVAHLRLVGRRPGLGAIRVRCWPNYAVLLLIALTMGVLAADPGLRPALLEVAALFGVLTMAAVVFIAPDKLEPPGPGRAAF